jgi:hypothetical protein
MEITCRKVVRDSMEYRTVKERKRKRVNNTFCGWIRYYVA